MTWLRSSVHMDKRLSSHLENNKIFKLFPVLFLKLTDKLVSRLAYTIGFSSQRGRTRIFFKIGGEVIKRGSKALGEIMVNLTLWEIIGTI